MCLYVERSFVKNPIPAVICWKLLRCKLEGYNKKTYYTPTMNVPIPKTGILEPNFTNNRKHKEYKKWDTINGGYIHAYQKAPKRFWTKEYTLFKAIATNIIATGQKNDLVCKALYIPELDLTIKS